MRNRQPWHEWKAAALAVLLLILAAAPSHSQREPLMGATRKPEPEPDPGEIVHDLLSQRIEDRIRGLTEVGVAENLRQKPPGPNYEDFTAVRNVTVRYVRLDDDPQPEVILTFNQSAYAQGAVFRREAGNWFQVALLNYWCKYERDPLARFLEVRQLVDPQHDDLIVRDSLGGTGVYWRDAVFYRMRNGELREILRVPEERRNSYPRPTVTRSTVFYANWTPEQQAVVVTTEKGRVAIPPPQGDFYPPLAGNFSTSVPTGCVAYLWNESKSQYVEDAKTTAVYCKPSRK